MKTNFVSKRINAVALATQLCLAVISNWAYAGEGHDHGPALTMTNANGPQRLADGSVFLPRPAQRQLSVRTMVAEAGDLPRAFELNGRVLMDPNAGGKVQAIVAGRVTPGPKGLPMPGQIVRKGEVLAYVTPEIGSRNRSLAESRLQRLRELSDTVPRKLIEEAEAAVANEQLVAPVDGVVASAHVVSGQVVEAKETLFEVMNPQRLLIEALVYDVNLANDLTAAYLVAGNERTQLKLQGVARVLRDQALPISFRGDGAALSSLAVGQPVKVYAQSKQTIKGIAVPSASLMKNPANQPVVWVKSSSEKFEPRTVTFEPLDGTRVAVTSGLKPGDRVATQGATLINQVR